mmetsp:Transcript_5770/g.16955  ORF Transcript_5770/g.16955 Transcript_5770/m.16955 type:complete len:307 (-) Transcript_5770:2983-3903(-)
MATKSKICNSLFHKRKGRYTIYVFIFAAWVLYMLTKPSRIESEHQKWIFSLFTSSEFKENEVSNSNSQQNILDRVNNLTNKDSHGIDRFKIFESVPNSCTGFKRLGDKSPGESKNVCQVAKTCGSYPCTVLSFGSNGQFDFEEDLIKNGCMCDIVVYDCTGDFKSPLNKIKTHKLCLDSYSHSNYVDINSVFKKFKNIRILKIDIEGYEWEIFSQFFPLLWNEKRLPYMILLELHIQSSFKELSWSYKNEFISSQNIRSKRVHGGKSVAEMAILSQLWSNYGYRLLSIEQNAYSRFAAELSLYRAV